MRRQNFVPLVIAFTFYLAVQFLSTRLNGNGIEYLYCLSANNKKCVMFSRLDMYSVHSAMQIKYINKRRHKLLHTLPLWK